jgi:hypothetical protein
MESYLRMILLNMRIYPFHLRTEPGRRWELIMVTVNKNDRILSDNWANRIITLKVILVLRVMYVSETQCTSNFIIDASYT